MINGHTYWVFYNTVTVQISKKGFYTCSDTTVAPGNLKIISSVGLEVYSKLHLQVMSYDTLKIMFSHSYILAILV